MKEGGYDRVARGFTIIEVMIVLAVSGLLLLSAVVLINGRQQRTEFTTGINDLQQQLQQIINETASGYYPNAQDFTCTGSPSSSPVIFSLRMSGAAQGTNFGCIFLGKAIQLGFGINAPDSGTLGVLPIVGNQYQVSGGVETSALTVLGSIPRAAYPSSNAELSNVPTSTLTTDAMEYGLSIASGNNKCTGLSTAVCYLPVNGSAYLPTGMAAFVAGDNQGNLNSVATGSLTNLNSSSQQLSLYGVQNSLPDESSQSASLALLSSVTSTNLSPAQEILICVASGSTSQSGLFTIGDNAAANASGGLSVTLTIMSDQTC